MTTVQSKAGQNGRLILNAILQSSEKGKTQNVIFDDSDESDD